jgi:tetratricopeptide (TPR) repeat protein
MKPIVELFRLESAIQQYKARGQFELALQFYDKIIQIKQDLSNKLGLAKTIAEKAYLLEQMGFRNEAVQNYQYAWQIAGNTPCEDFVASIQQRLNFLGFQ